MRDSTKLRLPLANEVDVRRIPLEVADSLARKLEGFAAGLAPDERATLDALLWSAMDPVDRAGARDSVEVFDEHEAKILAELESEFGGTS